MGKFKSKSTKTTRKVSKRSKKRSKKLSRHQKNIGQIERSLSSGKIDENDLKYLSILNIFTDSKNKENKEAMSFIMSKLSQSSRSKLSNVTNNFIQNSQFRREIIKVVKTNYDTVMEPYKNIKTQEFKPSQLEKDIITAADESYTSLEDRNKNIGKFKYLLSESTNKIAVYQNKTFWTHQLIVAFRGTYSKKDLIPDVYILRNKHDISNRFKKSLDFCDKLIIKYPKASLFITGHSLGGAMAIWIRQHRKYMKGCYVFNPGYNGYFNNKMNLNFEDLTICMVKGDIISNTLLALPKSHLPDEKNLIILEGDLKNPIQNHSMTNFTKLV